MNTIGNIFRLTTFGESHGAAMGGVIDGVPAGIEMDLEFIQSQLDRRRPGQSLLTTSRKEGDKVEFLSGVFEGRTTGTSIGFIIRNTNTQSGDYDNLRNAYRPSHADYTYTSKYGDRDHRGGGRSSARETVSWVVAGAVAKLVLKKVGVSITAYTSQIGPISLDGNYTQYDLEKTESNAVRCPDQEKAEQMQRLVEEVKGDGDSIGGVISGVIRRLPVGLGSPVFHKFHADLGAAMLSINAAKGFEYGMGFAGVANRGSQMNDRFVVVKGQVKTETNHSGGVQGGITNGEDVYFRVAFKPVATLLKSIETIDRELNRVELKVRGRHDPCVVPRAVPIVESLAAMVSLDHLLLNQACGLKI